MLSTLPILTSSWRATIDPEFYCRVGISRGTPRGQEGFRRYGPLAPGPWWRDISDETEWVAAYESRVLGRLDPPRVVAELHAIAGNKVPVLMCWERPPPDPAPCHRALVSRWIFREIGIEIPELGHEGLGHGNNHPKLSRIQRATCCCDLP